MKSHLFVLTLILWSGLSNCWADEPTRVLPPNAKVDEQPTMTLRTAVQRALRLIDVVMERHVDPPARQQMFLQLVKEIKRQTGDSFDDRIASSRFISMLITNKHFMAALEKMKPLEKRLDSSIQEADANQLMRRVLTTVPGEGQIMSQHDAKVERQLDGNRYVGIGITLMYDRDNGYPAVGGVFPKGPASKAGLKAGDLFVEVEETLTKNMDLREFIPLVRGDEGSTFSVKVRQPSETKLRSVTMTRRPIQRDTVKRIDINAGNIGYLSIEEIGGSTVTELRELEREFHAGKFRALIIDLTQVRRASLHYGVMLADALLESGVIGRVQRIGKPRTIQATGDSIFQGIPIALIVNNGTFGVAEWVAAALQDNKRAVVVGSQTAGVGFVNEPIAVPETKIAVSLATAVMFRGDGRAIQRVARDQVQRASSRGRVPVPNSTSPVLGGVQPDHAAHIPRTQPGRKPTPASGNQAVKAAIGVLRKQLNRTDTTTKDASSAEISQ